jgi:concentrative nucleoside transporter, CNT family
MPEAYPNIAKLYTKLSPKTLVIVSFAHCCFTDLSSVATQGGCISQLAPTQRQNLAALGFKALICGTIASYLSATLAGIIM